VPYNGSSAQAIRAMIAGDVAMFMVGTSTALPFIKNGNVRALAVTSTISRVDGLPDVPTFAEAGLPQVDYSLWFAIAVPSATPAVTTASPSRNTNANNCLPVAPSAMRMPNSRVRCATE